MRGLYRPTAGSCELLCIPPGHAAYSISVSRGCHDRNLSGLAERAHGCAVGGRGGDDLAAIGTRDRVRKVPRFGVERIADAAIARGVAPLERAHGTHELAGPRFLTCPDHARRDVGGPAHALGLGQLAILEPKADETAQ